jgi:hypothetical protein
MADGQEIKVNFPPDLQGGVYSNNMVVAHTRFDKTVSLRSDL